MQAITNLSVYPLLLLLCITTAFSDGEIREYHGVTPKFRESFRNTTMECMKKFNTDLVRTVGLYTFNTPDRGSKCAVLCILQHQGIIDKNGNYEKKKYDIMLDNLPPSDFRTAFGNNLRGCLIEDSTDKCEKAYRFTSCLQKKWDNLPKVPEGAFSSRKLHI